MRIYHEPVDESGYGRVTSVHDAARMLTPVPEGMYIEIDPATNNPLYYDVLLHPRKYLVDTQGFLYVDEDWTDGSVTL